MARKYDELGFLIPARQYAYYIRQLRLLDFLVHSHRIMYRICGCKYKYDTTSGFELLTSEVGEPGKEFREAGIYQYEIALAVLRDIFKC